MKKIELVFIPAPGIGHLVSTVELGNELVSRDDRFSAMVLVIKSPFELSSSPLPTNSQANIQYFEVPKPLQLPPLEFLQESLEKYISLYIESHKSRQRYHSQPFLKYDVVSAFWVGSRHVLRCHDRRRQRTRGSFLFVFHLRRWLPWFHAIPPQPPRTRRC